jgi:hypothetical protein
VTENDIWSSVSFFSVEAGDGGYDRVLSVGAGEGGASGAAATAWTANDDGRGTGNCRFHVGLVSRIGGVRFLQVPENPEIQSGVLVYIYIMAENLLTCHCTKNSLYGLGTCIF